MKRLSVLAIPCACALLVACPTLEESVPTTCTLADNDCINDFVAALNQANSCFGHPSRCSSSGGTDASQCGVFPSADANSCAWSDGAQVTFPNGGAGSLFQAFDFIATKNGTECYRVASTQGTPFLLTWTMASTGQSFVESLGADGQITLTCPSGQTATASSAELALCKSSLPELANAGDGICCSYPAQECPQAN